MSTHRGIAARTWSITALAAVALAVAGCGRDEPTATAVTPGASSSTSASVAAPSPNGAPQHPQAPSTAGGTAVRTRSTALLPVWPFTTAAQVRQWQAAYRAGGQQPWHLDAGATALAFTRGHLGYVEVDRITSRRISNGDAHIGVGWRVQGSRYGTAAVLHLIKFGTGPDAPWVVVGTDDTQLTLATPRYGSTVTSPVRVGGRITGVDESLRVRVLGPASSTPLFSSRGLPAGGTKTPWSTIARFHAPHGTVLTIAVSTGGHLKAVEEFAITAVRVA